MKMKRTILKTPWSEWFPTMLTAKCPPMLTAKYPRLLKRTVQKQIDIENKQAEADALAKLGITEEQKIEFQNRWRNQTNHHILKNKIKL